MTLITTGMVLALLILIALLCRQCNAWERLAARQHRHQGGDARPGGGDAR